MLNIFSYRDALIPITLAMSQLTVSAITTSYFYWDYRLIQRNDTNLGNCLDISSLRRGTAHPTI
jgi:hypothetical protein